MDLFLLCSNLMIVIMVRASVGVMVVVVEGMISAIMVIVAIVMVEGMGVGHIFKIVLK